MSTALDASIRRQRREMIARRTVDTIMAIVSRFIPDACRREALEAIYAAVAEGGFELTPADRHSFEQGRHVMTTAEILRAAKARLIQRGWCQGDKLALNAPPDGPCCAATAMSPFIGESNARIFAPSDLFKKANGITGNIGDWNDAPERTLEEVLSAYDKAIATAEAQGNGDGN